MDGELLSHSLCQFTAYVKQQNRWLAGGESQLQSEKETQGEASSG